MEQWFEKKRIPILRRDLWQVQEREQTQEVRLSEGMPDVGSVISARGQCVLRSKEWNGDSVGVSGGVMVWVVYHPADGSEPRVVEAWIPVQADFDLRQSNREGNIRTSFQLRSIDARSTSPRKMMVRANISVLVDAVEPWDAEIAVPGEVEPDVQILKKTYPAILPVEAGEKSFEMEESLSLPSGMPVPDKILSFELVPKLTEMKIMGGKAVFRGIGQLRLCYGSADGMIRWTDLEASFSQFADLDKDYEKDSTLSCMVVPTNVEVDLRDGSVQLNCRMVAQYLVYDRIMVELVEDAYSLRRQMELHTQPLDLPMVLEQTMEDVRFPVNLKAEATEVLDAWCYSAQPALRRAGSLMEIQLSGLAGVMYRDGEGVLRGMTSSWQHTLERPVAENVGMGVTLVQMERPMVTMNRDEIELKLDMTIHACAVQQRPMDMVSGMDLGDAVPQNPSRPSLILRRASGDSLWEIAKRSGSTVDAIRMANGLNDEPLDGRMLLIPVS